MCVKKCNWLTIPWYRQLANPFQQTTENILKKKEKLLITDKFSFAHVIFYFVSQQDLYLFIISMTFLTLSHMYILSDASAADDVYKTLWQKKKLLMMSNFFFYHSINS